MITGREGLYNSRDNFLFFLLITLNYNINFISITAYQVKHLNSDPDSNKFSKPQRQPVVDRHIAFLVHVHDKIYWCDIDNDYIYFEPILSQKLSGEISK